MKTFSTEIKEEICAAECNISDIINGFLYAEKSAAAVPRYSTQSEIVADFIAGYLRCGIAEKDGIYSIRVTERGIDNADTEERYGVLEISDSIGGADDGLDIENGIIDVGSVGNGGAARLRAFLGGVFLARGAVVNPDLKYRLDLNLNEQAKCEFISVVTARFGCKFKMLVRRGKPLLYTKDGDTIADFLVLIGASNAAMSVMDTKIYKEISNNVNRAVNCDSANIEKAARTAAVQLENIELIFREIGRGALPRDLLDAADVRFNNMDFSMQEIADELKISKTGVSRRFFAIRNIAENIRGGTAENEKSGNTGS